MPTILIVDDSAMDRELAGGLLRKNPANEIRFASDGLQALADMSERPPDVVLTDMQMPNLNGLELVERIRADFPLVPVVLMTARGSEEIAVSALHAGAASYVPKRSLKHSLAETIERVLIASCEDRGMATLIRNQLTCTTSAFELTNDVSLIPALITYLRHSIETLGLYGESDRMRVGVALEEALVNAYYHGNLEISSELRETDHQAYYELARSRSQIEPYASRSIYVDVEFTPNRATYVVRDEGPGFDPDALPDPTDEEHLDRSSGRGLLLMRTFMDEVRFNAQGNEVTLTKLRSREKVASQPQKVEA